MTTSTLLDRISQPTFCFPVDRKTSGNAQTTPYQDGKTAYPVKYWAVEEDVARFMSENAQNLQRCIQSDAFNRVNRDLMVTTETDLTYDLESTHFRLLNLAFMTLDLDIKLTIRTGYTPLPEPQILCPPPPPPTPISSPVSFCIRTFQLGLQQLQKF